MDSHTEGTPLQPTNPEGSDVADQSSPPPPPPQPVQPTRASDDVRKAALAQHVASAVASQNARVESQSDYQAVLVTGQKVNHVLHLLISLFTCGLWVVVWLVLAASGGEKRHIVQVDEWGNVIVQHV